MENATLPHRNGPCDTSGGLSLKPKLLLSQQVEGNFGHHPSQYNGNENGSCSLVSHPLARKVTPLVWDWGAKSAQPRGLLLSSENAPEEQSFISESCCNALILCTFPQMAAIAFSFLLLLLLFCISACCLMWVVSFCLLFCKRLGVCMRAPFRLSIRHSCGQATIFSEGFEFLDHALVLFFVTASLIYLHLEVQHLYDLLYEIWMSVNILEPFQETDLPSVFLQALTCGAASLSSYLSSCRWGKVFFPLLWIQSIHIAEK